MTCTPLKSWNDFALEMRLRASMLRSWNDKPCNDAARDLDRAAAAIERVVSVNPLEGREGGE